MEIHQIFEIEKKKHGIFRNIFNYGSVLIEFTGSPGPIEFHHIRNPRKIADLLESIKYSKPLEGLDLMACGVTCAKKYEFLAKKMTLSK